MITIDNFWDYTFAVWEEFDFDPENTACKLIGESKDGSKYYTDNVVGTKDISIYRVSDHWGGGIGTCNWYLNGYEPCNSYSFKEEHEGAQFVGIIGLSQFQEMNFKNWWHKDKKDEDIREWEYTCKDD